jgi:hypothetical protein
VRVVQAAAARGDELAVKTDLGAARTELSEAHEAAQAPDLPQSTLAILLDFLLGFMHA